MSREIIVDNFAGGGGASCGIEAAGYQVTVAINHDPIALAMHEANHPSTLHLVQNIVSVDPVDVAAGRPVGLAWFSPDCTHHSKASGNKPRSKRVRDLSWVVVQWAKRVRPRLICLENVEEIQGWGPLCVDIGNEMAACPECEKRYPLKMADRPCPVCAGMYWTSFCRQLRAEGYALQARELRACDYGSPTIRKRLFMVARCDGRPIVWPEPTHGPGRIPYRTAADCIDWSLPCPSIFGRKKPLAPATLRRIARGLKKYVLECPTPFLVPLTHQGSDRTYPLTEPFRTVTCANRGEVSLIAPSVLVNTSGHPGSPVDEPLRTVTTGGHHALMTPAFVTKFNQNSIGQGLESPLDTVMAGATRFGLVASTWMAQHNTGVIGRSCAEPLSTVMGTGTHQQLCIGWLTILRNNMHGRDLKEPVPTLTSGGWHLAEMRAFLVSYYGTDQDTLLTDPLPTITTKDRFGLVVTYQLADIGMRMLSPRELFRAQGFPEHYILDPVGPNGKPLTKTQQVKCCGNSVCPQVAEAIVRSNYVADQVPLRRIFKRKKIMAPLLEGVC